MSDTREQTSQEELKAKAQELYGRGFRFRAISRMLRATYDEDAPKSFVTIRNWYLKDCEVWDAALAKREGDVPEDLTVNSDLERLRRVRHKLNILIARSDSLVPAEVGELRVLFSIQQDLEKKLDPLNLGIC